MGYILNAKSDVWAENVTELYEEAVARQWSATRDIPWNELDELPSDLEHAMCQVCTSLTEVEMIAADLPAKWMWRMNHDFVEAKMFLCTQIMDEARHAEVFRKRALANGGGLLKSRSGPASLLRTIIEAKTYTQATALLHLLGEGFILDLFRQGARRRSRRRSDGDPPRPSRCSSSTPSARPVSPTRSRALDRRWGAALSSRPARRRADERERFPMQRGRAAADVMPSRASGRLR
jgi:hypothetical protein